MQNNNNNNVQQPEEINTSRNGKVPSNVPIDTSFSVSSKQAKKPYKFKETVFYRFFRQNNPFRMLSDQEWNNKQEHRRKRQEERQQWWIALVPNIRDFLYHSILFAGGVAWKSPHLKKDANVGRLARGGIVLVLAALQATVFACVIGYISHWVGLAIFIWVLTFYYFVSLEQSIQSRRQRSFKVVVARVLPALMINLASAFFVPVLFSQQNIKEDATKNINIRLLEIDGELSHLEQRRFPLDADILRKTGAKVGKEDKSVTAQRDALNKEKVVLLREREDVRYGSFAAQSLSFDKQIEYVWHKTLPPASQEVLAASWLQYQVNVLRNPSKKQSFSEAEKRRYDDALTLAEGKYAHQGSHLMWFLLFLGIELAPILLWLTDANEIESYTEGLHKVEEQRAHEAAVNCFSDTDFERVEKQAQKAPQYADYCEIIAREKARAMRANEKYAQELKSSPVGTTEKIQKVPEKGKHSAVPSVREDADDIWGNSLTEEHTPTAVERPGNTIHEQRVTDLHEEEVIADAPPAPIPDPWPEESLSTSVKPQLEMTDTLEQQQSFSLGDILQDEWQKQKEKRRNRRNS